MRIKNKHRRPHGLADQLLIVQKPVGSFFNEDFVGSLTNFNVASRVQDIPYLFELAVCFLDFLRKCRLFFYLPFWRAVHWWDILLLLVRLQFLLGHFSPQRSSSYPAQFSSVPQCPSASRQPRFLSEG